MRLTLREEPGFLPCALIERRLEKGRPGQVFNISARFPASYENAPGECVIGLYPAAEGDVQEDTADQEATLQFIRGALNDGDIPLYNYGLNDTGVNDFEADMPTRWPSCQFVEIHKGLPDNASALGHHRDHLHVKGCNLDDLDRLLVEAGY